MNCALARVASTRSTSSLRPAERASGRPGKPGAAADVDDPVGHAPAPARRPAAGRTGCRRRGRRPPRPGIVTDVGASRIIAARRSSSTAEPPLCRRRQGERRGELVQTRSCGCFTWNGAAVAGGPSRPRRTSARPDRRDHDAAEGLVALAVGLDVRRGPSGRCAPPCAPGEPIESSSTAPPVAQRVRDAAVRLPAAAPPRGAPGSRRRRRTTRLRSSCPRNAAWPHSELERVDRLAVLADQQAELGAADVRPQLLRRAPRRRRSPAGPDGRSVRAAGSPAPAPPARRATRTRAPPSRQALRSAVADDPRVTSPRRRPAAPRPPRTPRARPSSPG